MTKRKDGKERKALLLEAATKVFTEKGFRDTTIADICETSNSNTASVNYYFGSKEELYAEVWKKAFHESIELYPSNMDLSSDAPPQDHLKVFVNSFLHRMLDSGEMGTSGQILLMELTNPTDILEHIKKDAIDPFRKRLISIIRELLGEQTDEQNVEFCVMSVIHQCMGFGFRRGKLPPLLRDLPRNRLIDALTDHITSFSLAGIEAVKKETILSAKELSC
jgi:AcrR family transcriptional regulator